MAEILKEWITERLQQEIKWEIQEFGEMMKNGSIIASVLLSYNVINKEDHYMIKPCNHPEDIKSNWVYLAKWLHGIGIELSHNEKNKIMEGQGSSILRLFYQLFLHLDKRDRINFIKQEKKLASALVEKVNTRFKVDKVPEEKEPVIEYLSKPLLDERQFIEWQKQKSEEVQDTFNYIRHKYKRMLKKMEEDKINLKTPSKTCPKSTNKDMYQEMENFAKRHPCKFENYTYEDLLKMETEAATRKKSLIDSDWAKNYMDNLYTKINMKSETEEFQKQIRNALSASLWDHSIGEEETRLDTKIAKKVMKLSQFEKQMCTQIMETKQQSRNLIKNRIEAEKQFAEERTHQFNKYLDSLKELTDLGMYEIDFELRRQNVLHKKLYDEKIKRKRRHYYEICNETMLAIVDYATKYAYYRRLLGDDEIPEHFINEWKKLFFKTQPIFDILDPMEDILKEAAIEEQSVAEEEEEIVRLELIRQETLNDYDFLEYLNYIGPWNLDFLIPNYDSESEERKYEYLGTRILGHLVYTLLVIKYPYPTPKPPAVLPDFSSKAILRGLQDKSITQPMQTLLNFRKIHVVRLETTINYCLQKYKTEMIGSTNVEILYDNYVTLAEEESTKDMIRNIKAESMLVETPSAILGPIPPNTKQIQTPKTIPEEEIVLSTSAELGKYAYECLSDGNFLTDHLVSAMIVEYLKNQNDINGFVLINYPNSYREAQILEDTFTGIEPPDEGLVDDSDDIYLEENLFQHRKQQRDSYIEMRVSKLVSDPHKKPLEKPFESYFTCYIRLVESRDILQELFIWDLTQENSEFIDRFYAALGINYSMYYEVIDKDFLSQICKYIIGDYIMPVKSANNLFGENILSTLVFPSIEDKSIKSKILKPESKKSKDKGLRSTKVDNMTMDIKKPSDSRLDGIDEILEFGEAEEKNIEEQSKSSKTTLKSEEIKELLAGEEDWDYGDLPIPEGIGIALATCWEEVEKSYIDDMKQLFFAIRLQMNCLIPYTRFIKDKMEQIITLPSHKQDLVCNFQMLYNNYEDDWRNINVSKNEWHCRVKELETRLFSICDERKQFAEQQRLSLIAENWTMEELTSIVNNYISCMQTELNRSILTYQALHDFYYSMIKRLPPNNRLSSKDLPKISREADDLSSGNKNLEDKVFKQLKAAFLDLQMKNIEIDYSNNPFNLILENNAKFAIKLIKDTNEFYRNLIRKDTNDISKMVTPAKKKDDNSSNESPSPEDIFKQNALKCVEEWTMGVNGEMYRACLRILAIQYKCYHDMKLFNDQIYKTFMEVQDNINNYYMREITAVKRLCKYLQMAIETSRKIPETLILRDDVFLIDPNLLQFQEAENVTSIQEIAEISNDVNFNMSQLARLRTQFKIVAPTGIILQQAFIYLLQDFIIYGKESCDGPLLPELWNCVDPEQIPKLTYLLFGETTYVDWRDFLIHCLNIRFPNINELLEIRKVFRCNDPDSTELIDRDIYLKQTIWFENDLDCEDKPSPLRKELIKHFLFELFETSYNIMNYSAFLLAFCKDSDPIDGFVAALSLAVGKKICYSKEFCEEVILKLIKLKKYKDDSLACAHKCAGQFIDQLIINVVNICEGTTIEEIDSSQWIQDDKKGKKGKGATKLSKTPGASQNVRSSLSKNLSGNSRRTSDAVKRTYICRPCAEETEPEEKPKEVVQEVRTPSPREDPNYVYAVNQEVIWNVFRLCLPWHFDWRPDDYPNPFKCQIKEAMLQLENDTENGDIYIYKFISNPNVCKILHKTKKFIILNLNSELTKVFH